MADEAPYTQPEAFARLFVDSQYTIFRYIFGLLGGPPDEVEDLTSEVFFRAWRNRRSFHGDHEHALRWLLRIARNLVFDKQRRQKKRPLDTSLELIEPFLDNPHTELTPEEQAVKRQQLAVLWKLLLELDKERREMLVLRYLLEWPVKDVAAYLDLHENTVSQKIRRTLLALKENWPEKNRE